jgi:anaerobic selenocysteine-containing dehydrogenase
MTAIERTFQSVGRLEVPGFCTFCRSRCGSLNVIEGGRLVEVKPLPSHPTGKALCPKGRAAPEVVHDARRLMTPLLRTRPKHEDDPGWQPISWADALDRIAGKLKEIAEQSGPEAVAFGFTSPSAASISDSLPWLERFVWSFGSPNICWATELCNWHKDHGHEFTFGTGLPVPDYRNSAGTIPRPHGWRRPTRSRRPGAMARASSLSIRAARLWRARPIFGCRSRPGWTECSRSPSRRC